MLTSARLALVWGLAGCGPSDADALRTAWLVDVLYDDNRVWLSRDLALLEAKYATMAADPYDYMRGASAVFLADLGRTDPGRAPTELLTVRDASSILLAVDPHPENIGTLLPVDGPGPETVDTALSHPVPLLVEVDDVDGAAFGPYLVDTRRAVLGLAVAIAPMCDQTCRAPILTAWAEAYADEIQAAADGAPTFVAAPALHAGDAVLDRLLVDALEEGADRELLAAWTEPTADGRRFRVDDPSSGLASPSPEEGAQLDRLLAAYPEPDGFRALAVARRFGAGVASLPAVRYVVAWDRGGSGPEDDELLELREVVDPSAVPGLLQPPPTFDDQPERALVAAQALWSRPDADVRLAGLADGGMTFKARTASSYFQGFDHRALVRSDGIPRFAPSDLAAWAELLGRQLASVHARSVAADGGPALDAVAADLAGRADVFVAERVRDGEADLAITLRDHRLFALALGAYGPLLGADAPGTAWR